MDIDLFSEIKAHESHDPKFTTESLQQRFADVAIANETVVTDNHRPDQRLADVVDKTSCHDRQLQSKKLVMKLKKQNHSLRLRIAELERAAESKERKEKKGRHPSQRRPLHANGLNPASSPLFKSRPRHHLPIPGHSLLFKPHSADYLSVQGHLFPARANNPLLAANGLGPFPVPLYKPRPRIPVPRHHIPVPGHRLLDQAIVSDSLDQYNLSPKAPI